MACRAGGFTSDVREIGPCLYCGTDTATVRIVTALVTSYLTAVTSAMCYEIWGLRPRGRGGGGLAACSPPPQIKIYKRVFVDRMISKVLLDLPFSRNQPLELADDWCYVLWNMRTPTKGEGGLAACSSPPQIKIYKRVFVDRMISKVLRDLPFSRNQPLELADDWCYVLWNMRTPTKGEGGGAGGL
jgi:hypothetical protein